MLRFTRFFVAIVITAAASTASKAQNTDIPLIPTKGYDVHYYKTSIRLYPIQDSLSGVVEMTATSLGQLTEILQYAKFLSIDSVFVDGNRSLINVTDTVSGAYNVTGFPANYQNGSVF